MNCLGRVARSHPICTGLADGKAFFSNGDLGTLLIARYRGRNRWSFFPEMIPIWLNSRIADLGFQSPIPQVVRIEADAEKIPGDESELRRSHSDNADDDAICSGNDPALPQFLPYEDRRENS